MQIFDVGSACDITDRDDIVGAGKGAAGSMARGRADTMRRV
jgi:hypothetical protein